MAFAFSFVSYAQGLLSYKDLESSSFQPLNSRASASVEELSDLLFCFCHMHLLGMASLDESLTMMQSVPASRLFHDDEWVGICIDRVTVYKDPAEPPYLTNFSCFAAYGILRLACCRHCLVDPV